jgi:hypothetical protein
MHDVMCLEFLPKRFEIVHMDFGKHTKSPPRKFRGGDGLLLEPGMVFTDECQGLLQGRAVVVARCRRRLFGNEGVITHLRQELRQIGGHVPGETGEKRAHAPVDVDWVGNNCFLPRIFFAKRVMILRLLHHFLYAHKIIQRLLYHLHFDIALIADH